MSNKIRMADVFELPISFVEFGPVYVRPSIDEAKAAAHAINNHDSLLDQLEEKEKRIAELEAELTLIRNPSCEGETADAINDIGWILNDLLTAKGEISGSQFNNLKPISCEIISSYSRRIALLNKA